MKQSNPLLSEIARRHLGIPTLETRRCDSLDFHDVAVWQVKSALQAALDAGAKAGPFPTPASGLPTVSRLAFSAFLEETLAQQGWPDMEAVRRRAFAYYEQELAIKNGRVHGVFPMDAQAALAGHPGRMMR